MLDDALALRLCLIAPLLYLGLAMSIDPSGFIASLNNLRNFSQATHAPLSANAQPRSAVRVTGLMLIALIIVYSAS